MDVFIRLLTFEFYNIIFVV